MPNAAARRRRGQYGNREDAHFIAEVREKLGVTQDIIATALGITQGAVSQIEGRIRPLNKAMRQTLERLVVEHDATKLCTVIASGGSVSLVECSWQTIPAAGYIGHLASCPQCMAKAALTRNSRVARENGF